MNELGYFLAAFACFLSMGALIASRWNEKLTQALPAFPVMFASLAFGLAGLGCLTASVAAGNDVDAAIARDNLTQIGRQTPLRLVGPYDMAMIGPRQTVLGGRRSNLRIGCIHISGETPSWEVVYFTVSGDVAWLGRKASNVPMSAIARAQLISACQDRYAAG